MLAKVSILIPCYNAERWVCQAIQGALDQTYENKEVIVVDDGSSDKTLTIVQSFGDKIQWERAAHQGGNPARNRLLELSQGEWLQYLDADDFLMPDKISEQMRFSGLHPEADMIYSPVLAYEDFGMQGKKYVLEIPDKEDFCINFIRWGSLQTSAILWKKKVLSNVGGWKADQAVCQEHELMLRLFKEGHGFTLYDKANSVYRQRGEMSVSRKNKSSTVRERMRITDEMEQYLIREEKLTFSRRNAISLARFECARYVYPETPELALEFMRKLYALDKNFKPCGNAAPALYRVAYNLFGFNGAEKIAQLIRRVGISHWLGKGFC